MYIYQPHQVTDEMVAAFQRLIPQLTSNNPTPDRAHLEKLLASPLSTLLLARYPDQNGPIVASLSLTVYPVPTGMRAIIEDVIVDEQARGQGIGEALVRQALQIARQAGAQGVALTSNPRREAANRLYQRLGFVRRETNAYFYKF
ncbi:MAG: GNAT family N-acetyltransferase [Anaerolineae bacterium]